MLRLVCLLAVAMLVSGSALAQTAGEQAREACRNDAMKLCVGVSQGGGAILNCLTQQQQSLSAPCRKALEPRLKQNPWQLPPSK
jgi:hypothetical protein